MNDNLVFKTKIKSYESGKNILSLLTDRFTYLSHDEWQASLSSGKVRLNGEVVSSDHEVAAGDDLSYHPESLSEPEVSTDLEIIASTPEFIITGKPAGTPVSRTGHIVTNTVVNILRRKYNNPDIHLMHRLDRETSGLLLCTTSKEFCRKHQKNLSQIMANKYYLAIVQGKLEVSGLKIELPLGKDPNSEIRCRVAVDPSGKASTTIIHTVAFTEQKSLILAQLVTGRQHQIRCHLSYLGYPVIGDKIYNHKGIFYLKRLEEELTTEDYQELDARNQTLHAWAADINLPGQPQKLYMSHCFSADFTRHLKTFPAWQKSATILLEKICHP